ncbi:hypothetical protein [Litoribacter populi]|uniref:hypothetical protein n=1 Tax=Litoribacter populi TaxID=2598460 RepID=UPI00117F6457|nr:hypothetical protein [Litoribacter populi]
MAKARGIISLIGTISDITFYRMNGKYFARQKKTFNRKAFWDNDSYEGSRRSCAEFGTSSSFSAALRRVLYPMICTIRTGYFPSRLTALLRKVMKGDLKNDLGERKVLEGNLGLLKGLEVSTHDKVSLHLRGKVTAEIDTSRETVIFDFSQVKGLSKKHLPPSATHCRIIPGVVLLGENSKRMGQIFNPEFFQENFKEIRNLGREENRIIQFSQKYSKMLCCPVVGIYFYQLVNGDYYELKTGAALQILDAVRLQRPDLPEDKGRNWRDWIRGLAFGVL